MLKMMAIDGVAVAVVHAVTFLIAIDPISPKSKSPKFGSDYLERLQLVFEICEFYSKVGDVSTSSSIIFWNFSQFRFNTRYLSTHFIDIGLHVERRKVTTAKPLCLLFFIPLGELICLSFWAVFVSVYQFRRLALGDRPGDIYAEGFKEVDLLGSGWVTPPVSFVVCRLDWFFCRLNLGDNVPIDLWCWSQLFNQSPFGHSLSPIVVRNQNSSLR